MLNLVANGLFAATLAAALAGGIAWITQRPMFAVGGLAIEPMPGTELRHVSSALLQEAARREAQGGNFFTIDLDRVRAGFESVPWVRHAMVRRIWPNRLAVAIEEHRPFAFWGEHRLMNTRGELFTANLAEAEEAGPLPSFVGPPGSEAMVLRRYAELGEWLKPMGRTPEMLELSQRWAWTVRLDDGTTLMLGRDQGVPIEERVRRWVDVFPRVQAHLDRRAELVDLRYPSGFAIRSVALLTEKTADEPRRTRK